MNKWLNDAEETCENKTKIKFNWGNETDKENKLLRQIGGNCWG